MKWGHKMSRSLFPSFSLCVQLSKLFCTPVLCPHNATQWEVPVQTGVQRVHRCLEEEDIAQARGVGEAQDGVCPDS